MNDWIAPVIIIAALALIIGNFSTFQKSSKTPLRKRNLNDLEETLPRSHKKPHTLSTSKHIKEKNSD